jgi:uncharacterized membrane protein (UPF0136 family)
MQWIFVGICFFGTIAVSAYLKYLELNGGLTAAVVVALVLLTVYSLARIRPTKSEAEKVRNAGHVAEISEKGAHA